MGNDTQNNEEQLELLLMTLEDVKHGICLFQSKQQAKWVSLIQQRLGKEKIIVHNIADDREEMGMVTSQDFRRWASESEARVVVVYNVQLLGLRFGDEEAVEKLNFMRDQILSIGKLFVLGVSPYFDLLLSRKARDLYSCILYHFIFQDSEETFRKIRDIEMDELAGDDILQTERYKELKERIQKNKENCDLSTYLACMESWNGIREYISYQEKEFIAALAEEVDKKIRHKDIELADVENIWVLAQTWLELEKMENSDFWYDKALCYVKEKLGEEHEMYANALAEYAVYYETIGDYYMCQECNNQAISIYVQGGMKYSAQARAALQRKAIMYRRQSKFEEALNIYEELLNYQFNKYGKKYYGNAYIYNNIGRVYEETGDTVRALAQYEKAIELLDNAGKQGGWIWEIYQNICVIYLKNGDADKAWDYIKKAKRIAEDIYGRESMHLIYVYNSMSGVWSIRERVDKELEYLQKALELILKLNLKDSEAASYTYHNMGCALSREGNIEQAISYFKRAIGIRQNVYGEKNEVTASSYEMLSHVFYQVPNYAEGKKYIDKARNIYVSLYGNHCEHVKRIDEYLKSVKK